MGRNPVVECLHAKVPADALIVALGTENDDRLEESVRLANSRGIAIREVPRHELDAMTGNSLHQGVGLVVPPYKYDTVEELDRSDCRLGREWAGGVPGQCHRPA